MACDTLLSRHRTLEPFTERQVMEATEAARMVYAMHGAQTVDVLMLVMKTTLALLKAGGTTEDVTKLAIMSCDRVLNDLVRDLEDAGEFGVKVAGEFRRIMDDPDNADQTATSILQSAILNVMTFD